MSVTAQDPARSRIVINNKIIRVIAFNHIGCLLSHVGGKERNEKN